MHEDGAPPRLASVTTTERYTDLRIFGAKGAVERLPLPAAALAIARARLPRTDGGLDG